MISVVCFCFINIPQLFIQREVYRDSSTITYICVIFTTLIIAIIITVIINSIMHSTSKGNSAGTITNI